VIAGQIAMMIATMSSTTSQCVMHLLMCILYTIGTTIDGKGKSMLFVKVIVRLFFIVCTRI